MKLDLATFLLQWATGGLAFLLFTTRRRELGIGYGWLLRATFGLIAFGAAFAFASHESSRAGDSFALVASGLVGLSALVALWRSVATRAGGVTAFDPRWDALAPVCGIVGLFGAAEIIGGGYPLALARLVIGALFLGAVSDAMLLGHWYLVQPGLRRDPLQELVRFTGWIWPFEVLVLLIPTGMVSVVNGTIDDGYNGLLGWVWIACAVFTIGLVWVTTIALKERYYSAVMSATGLLYLAILTAFGTDLIARAVLAP
jgi:hypothetical protein